VVEVSSFQLDTTINFRPAVAVLLNITADHLDRYPDMQAYAASKARIFANQQPGDVAVLNAADDRVAGIGGGLEITRLFFDPPGESAEGAWIRSGRIDVRCRDLGPLAQVPRAECEFSLERYRLPGRHNRENAAAACLAALAAGATPDGIQAALDNFVGLSHRLSHTATVNGVEYYDDSKATNTDATARAVEAFDRPVVLILGGRDKGGDWHALKPRLHGRVKDIIVVGEAADRIRGCLAPEFHVTQASDMQQAVRRAGHLTGPGDVVLLAPGCASFDRYTSYAERGDDFIRQVYRMEARHDR
jgi:UDP-N-acetylmuramoylalanine--D-glutamate ligase